METFNIDPQMANFLRDMSDEEIVGFVELQEPTDDTQIELFIYTCFLIFKRTHSVRYLERALPHSEGWRTVTPEDHPQFERRCKILVMKAEEIQAKEPEDFSDFLENNGLGIQNGENLEWMIPKLEALLVTANADHPTRRTALHSLSMCHNQLFQRTGDMRHLDRAIEFVDKATSALSFDDADLDHATHVKLAELMKTRFERTEDLNDLNRAIHAADLAVELTPSHDQVSQAHHFYFLGLLLGSRYRRSMEMDDINKGNYAAYLENLATSLFLRYDYTQTREDLDQFIEVCEITLAAKLGYYNQPIWLLRLGLLLQKRFNQSEAIEDLNRAVDIASAAVAAMASEDTVDQSCYFDMLVSLLKQRFNLTQAIGDLNRLVEIRETALATTPNYPDRASWLEELGALLKKRFDQARSIEDLNRAVTVVDMAIAALSPDEHDRRADLLSEISTLLQVRYDDQKTLADLHRGIEVLENALKFEPDQSRRSVLLGNLVVSLRLRADQTGSMGDTDRALELCEMAMESFPPDDPKRLEYLGNSAVLLVKKFDQTGEMRYLNQAIDITETTFATMPPNWEYQSRVFTNHIGSLERRYQRTGANEDLQRSIEMAETVTYDSGLDSKNQAIHWANLGLLLRNQFGRTGSMDDLNRAVEMAKLAVKAVPPNLHFRPGLFINLNCTLSDLFTRTNKIEDLNSAIEAIDTALAIMTPQHSLRFMALCNLANNLNFRFDNTRSTKDLDRAIEALEIALTSIPIGHCNRYLCLIILAGSHRRLFEHTKAIHHLQRTIDVNHLALEAAAPGHRESAKLFLNAGKDFMKQYCEVGESKDFEQALKLFKEGWEYQNATPTIRIMCAQEVTRLLIMQSNWKEANCFMKEAVSLLPAVSPRSLKNADKEYKLGDFSGMASQAAAIALNAGEEVIDAFKLLELGRGVIAGLLLEMRTDVSDLKEEYPQLAEEFTALRDELDTSSSETAALGSPDLFSQEPKLKGRLEIDQQFDEVIARIRALPRFERFLLPPTADELRSAARQGPIVVINVDSHRCDAFLIESHQIRLLRLPNLSSTEADKMATQLRLFGISSPILEWLWDVVTCPVLDALGFKQKPSDTNWPHVWWIPTGALTHLPLHASGYQSKGSSETVLDRVMSSYISSVKALIYGRRNSTQRQTGRETDQQSDDDRKKYSNTRALLVAMRETPGLKTNSLLPYAAKEVEMLDSLCPSLNWKSTQPTRRRKEVLEHMRACKVFHFAGHGQSDPFDPAQSSLLLEDWRESPLTVGDLRDHRLQENSPFLCYLSACSTGTNKGGKLIDEGIHLASAFQLAGFRHVVGTLWEVSDRHCIDVAKVLYETIRDEGMTDEAVYRGLHFAVIALRDRTIETRKPVSQSNVPAKGRDDTASIGVEIVDQQVCKGGEMKKDENASQVVAAKATGGMRSVSEEESDNKRMDRDAKLISFGGQRIGQEDPKYWAPYIHFGV